MKLEQVLRVQAGDIVSFIGAGGKTSALFRLGYELAARGWRVLGTTTTRVAADEVARAPLSLTFNHVDDAIQITRALNAHRFVFLYGRIQEGKATGISSDMLRFLLDRANSDLLLVEADGARRLPFKAPYKHEPVIPSETTRVVLCAGMDVIGQPLDADHVYNPQAMIRRYGYPPEAPIVWPWLASVLRDSQLGLLNVPASAPVTVLLNKTPAVGIARRRAQLIASLVLRSPQIQAVAIGEMQSETDPVHEVRRPIAAIVLAAGMSSRMGDFKVLLPWGKQTVLEAILHRLLTSRLDQVIVVTGRDADRVGLIAAKMGARAVYNEDYATGEMLSSLQTGLRALDDRVDGALVVLGDQPQLQTYVTARVLDAYAEGRGSIVIPSHQHRRGHPVLFSRKHFAALLALSRGQSPRDLVAQQSSEIAYVNVNTDSILQDLDTPADYQLALRRAGLA